MTYLVTNLSGTETNKEKESKDSKFSELKLYAKKWLTYLACSVGISVLMSALIMAVPTWINYEVGAFNLAFMVSISLMVFIVVLCAVTSVFFVIFIIGVMGDYRVFE